MPLHRAAHRAGGSQASCDRGNLLPQTPTAPEQLHPLQLLPSQVTAKHLEVSLALLKGAGGTLGTHSAPIPTLGSEGGNGGGEASPALP